MSNQNLQQQQIKEIFNLTNLTRIEASQNRKVLRQLDLKLIQLNHSLHNLEFHISRLQVDRNFIMSILQICSHLSILLVGIIQLNRDLDAVYKYMHTTLSSNTLSPIIISPSDLRKLLIEVETDLTGHPKLGLPTGYDSKNIWTYYGLLRFISMVYHDALFVIIPVPLIDKSQCLTVYKIHNLPILMPPLLKQFKYNNLLNDFIVITKDKLYITYPNSDEIFSCQLSAGHYCEINTLFYALDSTNHCNYYLLQNNLNKIEQYCSLSVTNQTTDQAISLNYYHWAIMTMVSTMSQVICLTSSYYIKVRCPVDIIFLPNACEAYTNIFYPPTRNSLSMEVDSRKIGSRLTNFTLEYKDIYDFAIN